MVTRLRSNNRRRARDRGTDQHANQQSPLHAVTRSREIA